MAEEVLNAYQQNKASHDAAVIDLIVSIPKQTPQDFSLVAAELNKFSSLIEFFSLDLQALISKIKLVDIDPRFPKIQSIKNYLLDVVDPDLKPEADPYCFEFCDAAKVQFIHMLVKATQAEVVRLNNSSESDRLESIKTKEQECVLDAKFQINNMPDKSSINKGLSNEQLQEIIKLNTLITEENMQLDNISSFAVDELRVSLLPGAAEILFCLRLRKQIRIIESTKRILKDGEPYSKYLDMPLVMRTINKMLAEIKLSYYSTDLSDYIDYLQRIFNIFNLSLVKIEQFINPDLYTPEMRKYMTESPELNAQIYYLSEPELAAIYTRIQQLLHDIETIELYSTIKVSDHDTSVEYRKLLIKTISELRQAGMSPLRISSVYSLGKGLIRKYSPNLLSEHDMHEYRKLVLKSLSELQLSISPIEVKRVETLADAKIILLGYRSVITRILVPNCISFETVNDIDWTALKLLAEIDYGRTLPFDLDLLVQHPIDLQILAIHKFDTLTTLCQLLDLKLDELLKLSSDTLRLILNHKHICERLKSLQEIHLDIKSFLISTPPRLLSNLLDNPELSIRHNAETLRLAQIKLLCNNLTCKINEVLRDYDETHQIEHLYKLFTRVTDGFTHELKQSGMNFHQYNTLQEEAINVLHGFVEHFLSKFLHKSYIHTPRILFSQTELELWFNVETCDFIKSFFTNLSLELEQRVPRDISTIPERFRAEYEMLIDIVLNPQKFDPSGLDVDSPDLEEEAAKQFVKHFYNTFDDDTLEHLSVDHLQLFQALLFSGIFGLKDQATEEPWRKCAAIWSDCISDDSSPGDFGLFDFKMIYPNGEDAKANATVIAISNFFQRMRKIASLVEQKLCRNNNSKYIAEGEDELFKAIQNDSLLEVQQCINNGHRPIGVSHKGISYLAFACAYGNAKIIAFLKQSIISSTENDLKIFMQRHQFQSSKPCKVAYTPKYHFQIISPLQFATNKEGLTVFQKAVIEQRHDLCSALLARGINPFAKCQMQATPFELAKSSNQTSLLIEFWNNKIDKESQQDADKLRISRKYLVG